MKTMRINKTMRIGVIAAFVAILTIVGIAGTFAKYTGSAAATNTARVAAWGLTLQSTAGTNQGIFDSAYPVQQSGTTVTGNSVAAYNSTDLLIAPGTSKPITATTIPGVSITGTSEVAVRLSPTVAGIQVGQNTGDPSQEPVEDEWVITVGSGAETQKNFYCPLIFTIGDSSVGTDFPKIVDGRTYYAQYNQPMPGTGKSYPVVEFIKAVNQAFLDYTNAAQLYMDCAPNTPISTSGVVTLETPLKFSWEWDFDDNGAGTWDIQDTLLGSRMTVTRNAAGEITNITGAPTITMGLGLAATQIN